MNRTTMNLLLNVSRFFLDNYKKKTKSQSNVIVVSKKDIKIRKRFTKDDNKVEDYEILKHIIPKSASLFDIINKKL